MSIVNIYLLYTLSHNIRREIIHDIAGDHKVEGPVVELSIILVEMTECLVYVKIGKNKKKKGPSQSQTVSPTSRRLVSIE